MLVLAGCARSDPVSPAGADVEEAGTPVSSLAPADYEGRYRVVATVLESPGHGPQLCNAVAQSYPPQCGGPDIIGWDWTRLGAESASGTTWGDYVLTGTWDGAALTLTEPPRVPTDADRPADVDYDFSSPCDPPAGGWVGPDPARAGDERIGQAATAAVTVPGYGGLWIDTAPGVTVLNVTTTGDRTAMETAMRDVWGGALCVSDTPNDEATLLAAQRAISGRDGVLSSGPDVVTGRLQVQVLIATGTLQSALDDEFGAGVIVLQSMLTPID
ncbi:MAG: hypothetical protein H0T85_09725 [Geodermatophilaceae bacterium]|nr:hypothetical protein [Geodermatophilaceae bacterium]